MSFVLIFLYIFGEEIRATENFLRDSYLCTGTVGQALSVTDALFLLFCVLRIFINLATVLSLKGIIIIIKLLQELMG